MQRLCLIGSCDTKGDLLRRLRRMAAARGARTSIADMGLKGASRGGKEAAMRRAAERLAAELGRKRGCSFLAIGGGTGSWVALKAMASLPQGPAKALVTTLAFDPRPLVAGTDIVLVPSPVDLFGSNPFVDAALERGVAAALGVGERRKPAEAGEPMVAVTALGVVQRCAELVTDRLERAGHRTCVFHAAGENGRTLCRWLEEGRLLKGVVDLVPNDLQPLIGNLQGRGEGMNRLKAARRAGTPYLLAPGGLDFLTRPTEGLSSRERLRPRHVHGPTFTHVRTTGEQVKRAARFVAGELGGKRALSVVAVPEKGWSQANRAGRALSAPRIDGSFAGLVAEGGIPRERVLSVPAHINSAAFADRVAQAMEGLLVRRESRIARRAG